MAVPLVVALGLGIGRDRGPMRTSATFPTIGLEFL